MTVDTRLFTAEELYALPDDGFRYELVDGELRTMSPAGGSHGSIAARILIRLGSWVEQHGLGDVYAAETGFLLSRNPDTVLAPDVAFVRAERVVRTPKFVPVVPDLVVEVISPSDSYREVEGKAQQWLRTGVRAMIIVEPETRTVRIHRTSGITTCESVLAVENIVSGWQLPLADLFTTAR